MVLLYTIEDTDGIKINVHFVNNACVGLLGFQLREQILNIYICLN